MNLRGSFEELFVKQCLLGMSEVLQQHNDLCVSWTSVVLQRQNDGVIVCLVITTVYLLECVFSAYSMTEMVWTDLVVCMLSYRDELQYEPVCSICIQ